MARQTINNGTEAGDGTGESLFDAFAKVNANFLELYTSLPAHGQIKFPATQASSSDPNTLDDYEEGNWSPTLAAVANCSGLSVTYGRYTKIGNIVHLEAIVAGTVTASNLQTIFSLTLPFNQFQNASGAVGAVVEQNNNRGGFVFDSSGSTANGIVAVFPAASEVVAGTAIFSVGISYRVAG